MENLLERDAEIDGSLTIRLWTSYRTILIYLPFSFSLRATNRIQTKGSFKHKQDIDILYTDNSIT